MDKSARPPFGDITNTTGPGDFKFYNCDLGVVCIILVI
jgi:hypothetical protein